MKEIGIISSILCNLGSLISLIYNVKQTDLTAMRWTFSEIENAEEAQALCSVLSTNEPFPLTLANVLLHRNVHDIDSAKNYFNPETFTGH